MDEHGRVIPVGLVHELAADSEVVRMLTALPTGQVLDVGHSRRLASTRQRTAARDAEHRADADADHLIHHEEKQRGQSG